MTIYSDTIIKYSYIEIIINQDKFRIKEKAVKPTEQDEFNTLYKIERIIKWNLECHPHKKDLYSELNQEELYKKLKVIAKSIKDRSIYARMQGITSQQYAKILPLPEDIILNTCTFLDFNDLLSLACVSVYGNKIVGRPFLIKAKKYGYEGNEFGKAKKYLENIFSLIHFLEKKSFSKGDKAMKKNYLELESTLKNFKLMRATNLNYLQTKLDNRLLTAAENNKIKVVKGLLSLGANINVKNNLNYTPLYLSKTVKVMTLLLRKKADPNIAGICGLNPLYNSVNNPEMVKLLLQHGANVNGQTNLDVTALHKAVNREQVATVKILLSFGADINFKSKDRRTPLQLAYHKGNQEIISLLLGKE